MAEQDDTTCNVRGCDRDLDTNGMCGAHYQRWRSHGDPDPDRPIMQHHTRTCDVGGCDRMHYGRGWCSAHYNRWLRDGDVQADKPVIEFRVRDTATCKNRGCTSPAHANGRCKAHDRLRQKATTRDVADPSTCRVRRCPAPAGPRDWCWAHYNRWRKYGDVHADVPLGNHLASHIPGKALADLTPHEVDSARMQPRPRDRSDRD